MLLEYIFAIFSGILAGIICGLIPGIHINLVALVIFNFSPLFLTFFSITSLAVFITAMAVTFTFHDSIPSTFLGCPDEAQALGALPAHRMLLKGNGYEAVLLTVIGSFFCLVLSILFLPLFIKSVAFLQPLIKSYIGYILIIIMTYMILKEKNKLKITFSFFLFLLSGSLGLIVLNIPNLNQPLFHLLSGLFGFSILVISLLENSIVPKQKIPNKFQLPIINTAKSTIAATTVGFIAAFLPGFGSSQAAIIASNVLNMFGKVSEKGFIILVGGINTANMIISFATLYSIDKARNGAVLIIKNLIENISRSNLFLFITAAIIAGGVSVMSTLSIARFFSKLIEKVNYHYLLLTVILFITVLSIYFDGVLGLLILFTSTFIGILATKLKIGKNHLMGCLILPVILYFIL